MANNNKDQQYRFFRELASAQNLDLTESVFATLQEQGKGDADRMTDILMNWMMDDPAMKELMMEDRKRRQAVEEEARKRADEERKKAEEERKKRDAEFIRLQEEAYQRLKKEREQELQRRAAEEAKKRADEEAAKKAVEDAQRKVKDEEDRRRKAKEEEEAKRFADEARKFAEEEARRRLAESQLKRDVKAAEDAAARKLKEEEEAKKKAAAAAAQKQAEEEAAKKAALAAAAQRLAEEDAKKAAAAAAAAAKPAPAPAPAPAAAPVPPVSEAKKKEDQAEYEKRLAELEQRLAEFEKARTSNNSANSNKDHSISSPKVCILTDNNTKEASVAEVTAFLATKGVKATDIRVVNASNDFELVAIVKDQREKLEFPFVLVQNNAIGTFAELQAVAAKIGVLEALLAGEKVDPAVLTPKKSNSTETPPELRLGIYDYGVTVGEYTLKAVLLPIVAPYRLLSWAFGGKQPELEKGEDFDVLQSNWYWRHQLRTLRFTAEHIIRLRPGYNDVRAAHRYEDVKEIKLIDPTYFTISYREGGSDWYRTTPQDVRRICEIICLKNRNVPNPLK